MPDALDDLLLTVPKVGVRPPRAVSSSVPRAPVASSSFDLDRDAARIKDAFRAQFGRELPVSAYGQTEYHKTKGRDHSGLMDVGLDPNSTGGKWLISYLKENGIPHIPQYGKNNLSTGPHVHVGAQSRKLDVLDDVLDQVPAVASAPSADTPEPDELDKLLVTLPSVAARLDDDGEAVEQVNSAREVAPTRPPPKMATFNPYTVEGRAARDAAVAAESEPNAVRSLRVQLPLEWLKLATRDVAVLAVNAYAKAEGIPEGVTASWLKSHPEIDLYDPRSGKAMGIGDLAGTPSYDADTRSLDVGAQLPQLSQLKRDYQAQRGYVSHAVDALTDDRTTAGEKAGAVASKVGHGIDVATRPLQALSTVVAGEQRAAGAMLAAPFSESARDVLNSGMYEPQAQLAAALHKLRTGETPTGYEQPVAEGLDLLSQLYRREPLHPLVKEAVSLGFDPVNYLPLDGASRFGASALSRLSEFGARVGAESRAGRLVSRATKLLTEAPDPRLDELFERGGRVLDLRPLPNDAELVVRLEDGSRVRVNVETGEYVELGDAPHHSTFQPRTEVGTFAPGSPARPADELDRLLAEVPPSASTIPRRAGHVAMDVLQLPKALRASYDFSAVGRQGLPQLLAHPLSIKAVMRDQVKSALSEDAFKAFASEITSRPDYRLMQESGLFLSSPRGAGLAREEVYASRLSEKIPGVAASDRAYSTALDRLRVNAWDIYTKDLAGKKNVGKETYKAFAELINISTGRGVVPILDRSATGRKIVDLLNLPFFSPRTFASRFSLLSPRRIVANAINPATRPVAVIQAKEGFRALATLTTTLGLLDNVPGVDVVWNPQKSDFGTVRVGKAVFDLTGGESHAVRYLVRMAHAFTDGEAGKLPTKHKTPAALTLRYLRSQLSPVGGVAVDAATGEDFKGRPFLKLQAAADLSVPMTAASVYEGWVAGGGSTLTDAVRAARYGSTLNLAAGDGLKDATLALPSILGVGVNFYDKPVDYAARREAAQVKVSGRAGEELKRLGVDLNYQGHRADKRQGQFRSLPSRVGSVVDTTVGFDGDSPGQSPEQLEAARREYERRVAEAVEAEIRKPGYAMFKSDEARRQYLQGIVATVRNQTVRGFNRETRGREIGELQRIKERFERLERKSGTAGVRHFKL